MQSHNIVTSTTVLLLESVKLFNLASNQVSKKVSFTACHGYACTSLKMKNEKMKKKMMSWIDYSTFVI